MEKIPTQAQLTNERNVFIILSLLFAGLTAIVVFYLSGFQKILKCVGLLDR